jgi:TonB family protein
VTKSFDEKYGLDEQAVKAVKQWQFKPGTKDEQPVDVIVSIEVGFHLEPPDTLTPDELVEHARR